MNINYDEIIAKANERAEKLKAFTALLRDAEDEANVLMTSLEYFASIYTIFGSIDQEGQGLIPKDIAQRATGVGYRAKLALSSLRADSSENLERLLVALRAAEDPTR